MLELSVKCAYGALRCSRRRRMHRVAHRPAEIPFQPKLANALRLVGVVQSPLQFLASPDGTCWAATLISRTDRLIFNSLSNLCISSSAATCSASAFRIPILFQGDLAHTAASHLRQNDNIYIAGHLTADKLPLTLTFNQHPFQVMVHSLNFVQGSSYDKSQFTSDTKDLKPNKSVSGRKSFDTNFWEDLVNNPTEWRDFRNDKINNVVKPKHPDFKHREDGRALWLNIAPSWIIEKLEGLEFHSHRKSLGHRGCFAEGSGVESWKDLIENPSNWWNNRADKATIRHPDFRHKDTGEGLWLNKAPQWAMEKLPPANASTGSSTGCGFLQ